MHELLRSGAAGDCRDPAGRFYVHGTKGFVPALDVEADRVDNREGAREGCGGRVFVVDPAPTASIVELSGNSDRTRSGWREATRTPKPAASRWRTMRRPRNPVPPNTVTVCTVMAQLPTAGELSRERAYQMRACGVMQLRTGYSAAVEIA